VVLVSVWLLVFRNRFTIPDRKKPHRLVACLPAEPKSNGSGPHSENATSRDLGFLVALYTTSILDEALLNPYVLSWYF
jgi:hypothetical protein